MDKKMHTMKVKKIIMEKFDPRLSLVVLVYTLDQLGLNQASEIIDDDRNAMEGNSLMNKGILSGFGKDGSPNRPGMRFLR